MFLSEPVAQREREREREPTIQLPWKEGFPEIVAQSLAFSPLLPDDGGINVGASFFASDIEDVKGTGGSFQSVTFSGVIYFNGGWPTVQEGVF